MAAVLKPWAERLFEAAYHQNLSNIADALAESTTGGKLLDLGCDDGLQTLKFASAARADEVHGVELIASQAELARSRGVATTEADLNAPLPFESERFDMVVSNQVIEHLANTDLFASEIRRVLRPGGFAVVSTENLASWHNIFALVLGWQPFSLSNVTSLRGGLGNPCAIHRQEASGGNSWQHLRVFAHRGLHELFLAHGFRVRSIRGAGYYPLHRRMGVVDPRHAAFLTITATL